MKKISKELKQKIRSICKKYGVEFAVLYGSSLKSSNPQDSDIALHSIKPIKVSLAKIQNELQPFFKKPLDIVFLDHKTDPLLAYEMTSQGQLLYEAKKDSFISFSVYIWKKYLDTKKFRDLEDLYIKEGLKNVS